MDLLAGRYRLAERIGEGGGGTVWRAVDELLRREVAIKQLRIPPGLSEEDRAAFTGRAIQEARAAGRLSHPAIVMIHDVVGHAGQPWIVMDLVPGRSLDKVVREDGPLPPARVAEIGLAVLDALQAAHAQGILHRDVKPGNVLIGRDGRAVLTDFGIAAPMGQAGTAAWQSSAGSPAYMAPERFRGEPDGPPSDLWSLGATLYTAVEGEPPFQRTLAAAVVAAVLLHEPRPMALAPPPLAWIVLALLDKDPARRPPPGVVRQALRAVDTPRPPAPAVRPRRTLRLLLAGALVVVIGVAAGLGAWRLVSGGGGEVGRFAAAPDPCRSLTDAEIRQVLGADTRAEPSASACQWSDLAGGNNGTITVTYVLPPSSQGEGGASAAELDFERRRAGMTRLSKGACRDRPDIGDEAFACDVHYLTAGATGATVWFRLSNLVVEVAYRRSGDQTITEADRRTAENAARLVGVGLG
ncbi:serine/threonine-protein kinase [Microbispora sp. NPDC049125]|uniref:serine/threonine-protein kinase n=1 Tax=Microbispora sp. NPDC049125 TaxID=3154929 RepID=UPI003467D7E1